MGNSVRAATAAVILLAAVAAVGQTLPFPARPGVPEPGKLKLDVRIPPLADPITDPSLDPAQLLQPVPTPGGVAPTIPDSPRAPGSAGATGVVTTPAAVAPMPAEPPPPTVRLQVQTPAHVAPGKPIPYKIIISNTSAATAHRVRVRVPAPPDMLSLNKAEPKPDASDEVKQPVKPDRELAWVFKALLKGEQKVIELEFTPLGNKQAAELKAYVSFEHGQVVETKIEKPQLTVKKTVTPQVARGEPATVRVEVTNAGAVPIHKVRLVEEATVGFAFQGATDALAGQTASQKVWELGTLLRGQSKVVTYKLLGGKQQGGELVSTSNATSEDGGVAKTVEAKARVLVPDLGFALTGPATVESRKPAVYEAEVRNNGTLPLANVVVSIGIPEGCLPSKVTDGATRYADRVSWTIPALAPGDGRKYRLGLTPKASGKQVIRATARDQKSLVDEAKEIASLFLGRADLHWKPDIPAIIGQGKQGIITVAIQNQGEETDKGVSPRIVLPDGLKVVQVSPKDATVAQGGEVVFNAVEIKPGKSEVFTVTVERTAPGQKRVLLRLEAQSLDKQPLLKEQTIE